MLYACDEICPRNCRIEGKGDGRPVNCPYESQTIKVKRVTDMPDTHAVVVADVQQHLATDVPSGWTLFRCLEHTETVYKVKYIPENLTADGWKKAVDIWDSRGIKVVKWVKIADIF